MFLFLTPFLANLLTCRLVGICVKSPLAAVCLLSISGDVECSYKSWLVSVSNDVVGLLSRFVSTPSDVEGSLSNTEGFFGEYKGTAFGWLTWFARVFTKIAISSSTLSISHHLLSSAKTALGS